MNQFMKWLGAEGDEEERREPGVGPGQANYIEVHASGFAETPDPLTPEVENSLEDMGIPVPQPLDELELTEPAAFADIDDGTELQFESREELRQWLDDQGFVLVPFRDLGDVKITEDGVRLNGPTQIDVLSDYLLSRTDAQVGDEGAGDMAVRLLKESQEEIEELRKDRRAHLLSPATGYPDGNPKTAAGAKKPDLSVVPPISILHLATAMMNGADKYGPFNWRDKSISTRPYVAAAMRHLLTYLDGENFSSDTVDSGAPVHHLAHVMACCAILLDAESIDMLNDNRPPPGMAGDSIELYGAEKRVF